MSFSPIHWLPSRSRAVWFLIVCPLWILLFAYGTIRLAIEREWGYSVAAALFALVFVYGVVKSWRVLRTHRPEDAAIAAQHKNPTPDPIE